jgi:hypothetical protein
MGVDLKRQLLGNIEQRYHCHIRVSHAPFPLAIVWFCDRLLY